MILKDNTLRDLSYCIFWAFVIWSAFFGSYGEAGTSLSLAWNPNSDSIDGYRVFVGKTNQASDLVTITDKPIVKYLAPWCDLKMRAEERLVCFRLKAFKGGEKSKFSSAICTNLTKSDFNKGEWCAPNIVELKLR